MAGTTSTFFQKLSNQIKRAITVLQTKLKI